MKKGLEKFISILLLALGGILVIFLALAVFGQLDEATMANEVVRAMILGLSLVFFVAAVVMIVLSFKDSDVLKAVVLSSERASTTRVSLSVIRRIVAKNAKYISGLKVTGVTLSLDENNAIRMKLTVKISENDVDFVVDRFRCLLYDAFYAVLGVEFASIDFQVKALSPKYAPDMNKVDRAAAEIKEKREKLMLQKLKMEEEEARFEEERKREAEKRRKEEARLRREREDERRHEREIAEKERFGDLADAEEVPVYVIEDDFAMPDELKETATGSAARGSELPGSKQSSESEPAAGSTRSSESEPRAGSEDPSEAETPAESAEAGIPEDTSPFGSENGNPESSDTETPEEKTSDECGAEDAADIAGARDEPEGTDPGDNADFRPNIESGGEAEIMPETVMECGAEASNVVDPDGAPGAAPDGENPANGRVGEAEISPEYAETLDGRDDSEYIVSVGSEKTSGDGGTEDEISLSEDRAASVAADTGGTGGDRNKRPDFEVQDRKEEEE